MTAMPMPSIPPEAHADTRPRAALILRENAFAEWLAKAEPGARITYHRGHLGSDREPGMSPFPAARRHELARIADRALALALEGRLHLLQERHGDGETGYLAVIASAAR
ncbi:MAG: hypothetical protein CMM08_20490 [Rhodospirillaceae bacterium]|jgi:hypothetical protein|nr:hypothetical protein [Rhodospirillaceae bacterium]